MKSGRAALVFELHDLQVIKWALGVCLNLDADVKRAREDEGIESGAGRMTPEAIKGVKRIGNRVRVAIKRAKA